MQSRIRLEALPITEFIVYVNLANTQSIGSGYLAYNNGGSVDMWSLVYYYRPTVGVSHSLGTMVAIYDTWTSKVQQSGSSTSKNWLGTTKGYSETVAFVSTTTPAGIAGNTARTFTSYTANTNDMPAKVDLLKTGRWVSGSINFDEYFSGTNTNEYKCFTGHGYKLDYLASYTGTDQWDKTGHGPRIYTTDNCISDSQGWDTYGE